MIKMRSLPLYALASACLFSASALAQLAAPTVRVVNPVDENQMVTLTHTVHPLARAANDRGAAPDGMLLDRLQLVLQRSPDQEAALRQLITQMHSPGSANYHQWLTPEQFGTQFGPSDQDIAAVSTWLGNHGFSVTRVNPGKGSIEFSGNVGQLRDAFHTQIHKYEVNGETHYANANDPSIPTALAPVIAGFSSLNNFRPRAQLRKLGEASFNPTTHQVTPQWTQASGTGQFYVLAPGDFAKQYDLTPLYNANVNGSGQTIAIINDSNINIDLVNQFRTLFSLPANPPQVIIDGNDPGVDGINNPDGPNFDSVEAYLDVEWAGAVAPNATIDLVIGADTAIESGLVLAIEHAVYSNVAPVISLSFGACESELGTYNSFLNNLWEQAAAQGQTAMVSAGDGGSAGCDNSGGEYAVDGQQVSGYASTPYNVAVGGTDFFYSSYNAGSTALNTQIGTYWSATTTQLPAVSLLQTIPEQPWNDSQYGLNAVNYYVQDTSSTATTIAAGSGGASNAAICSSTYNASTGACIGTLSGYAKPSWQSGAGVPTDNVRDLPDVSLFAANGNNYSFYPICATDGDCQSPSGSNQVQIYGVGGTSASSPAFAGIMSLVNQKYGRQGQADTVLYPLKTQFPAAFHDVTNGRNSVPCEILPAATPNCIAVTSPITVTLSTGGNVTEGQIGTGTTPDYNATAGYNLATGLGTVDANVLVNDWNKITLTSTTTTLTPPSPATFAHGTAVTIGGTVAGSTPTGNVALMTDSSEPNEQGQGLPTELNGLTGTFGSSAFTLNGTGQYTGSISTLPGGSYNIWTSYGGDSKNAGSVSGKTAINVTPENSGVFLRAISPLGTTTGGNTVSAPVSYGTQLMLSAQVAPSSQLSAFETCTTTCPVFTLPTGQVTFNDTGSPALPATTAVINAEGDAEFNAPFAVGTHSITASYSGDQSYNTSTSTSISLTVIKNTPLLFVGASNQIQCNGNCFEVIGGTNQPTVLNILIENSAIASDAGSTTIFPVPVAPPTGSLTFSGLPSGVPTTATLSAGVDPSNGAPVGIATVTIPASTSAITYNVTVSYGGDSNYAALTGSTAGSVPVQIATASGITTQTTAAMAGSISPNSTVTITGTVSATTGSGAPTGSVYLFSSGEFVTSATITSGSAVTAKVTRKSSFWPTAGGGALLAAVLFFWVPKRRRSWLAMLVMLTVLVSMYDMACGGGSSGSSSGGGGSTGGSGSGSGSGGTANFKFVLNSQTLVQGANFLVVQYAGTSTFLPSAYNLSSSTPVSNPLSDFSLISASSIVAVTAGNTTGIGDGIIVGSTNSFTGAVNLTCSGPTGITCSISPAAPTLSAGTSTISTLTLKAAAGTTAGNYPVVVTGKDSTGEYIHTSVIIAAVK